MDKLQSRGVIEDLQTWGPEARGPSLSVPEAETYCRTLAQFHYENFPVVTWMLPKHLRQHFYNVYAFCRWADDLGDEIRDPQRSLQLLDWWEAELRRCYAGQRSHPVYIALGTTLKEFEIPESLFTDLVSAFRQDQTVHEYQTRAQLLDYCRRSANPVGRILLCLCHRSNARNQELSDWICTGLQLANFWQDVARDYEIGRVYLPEEDRTRFGYTAALMQQKHSTQEFVELMQAEVNWARDCLKRGYPLVREMPGRLRFDIGLFAQGGLAILRAIEQIDFHVWEQRPTVSKRQVVAAGILGCLPLVRRDPR